MDLDNRLSSGQSQFPSIALPAAPPVPASSGDSTALPGEPHVVPSQSQPVSGETNGGALSDGGQSACFGLTELGLLNKLEVPADLSRVAEVSTDISAQPSRASNSVTSLLSRGVQGTISFLTHTARHEWHAAPISFLASFSSNFLTAFSVVACAPWFAKVMGGEGTVGYTFATSAAAVLIGYGTYLAGYYGMMAYKEKASCRAANKHFDTKEFLSVVAVDFTLHVPNDVYTMTTTGAFQVGLLASGTANLFWSVLVSQMVVDLLYSPKEAVYWSLAKAAVRKHRQLASNMLRPANQDTIEPIQEKRAVGEE